MTSKLGYIFKLNPFINKSILEENSKFFGINFSSSSCFLFPSGVGVELGVWLFLLLLLLLFSLLFFSFSFSLSSFFS